MLEGIMFNINQFKKCQYLACISCFLQSEEIFLDMFEDEYREMQVNILFFLCFTVIL